jgi:hypothetical protein
MIINSGESKLHPDKSWIFCHRGLWKNHAEQNSPTAVLHAQNQSFSAEIDLRIYLNQVYVSHDSMSMSENQKLNYFTFSSGRLALNIKSDGLYSYLEYFRESLIISNSFVFDGSIPEMLKYKNLNFPHALRLSEYEKSLAWPVKHVWLDGFYSDWWINSEEIKSVMEKTDIIIVSPEIHGREYNKVWEWLLIKRTEGYTNLSICTDKPEEIMRLSSGAK